MPTPPVPPPGAQPGTQLRGSRRCRRPCPDVAGPPLPDPAAVRLRTVPDSAPPYDDELAMLNASAGGPAPAGAPAAGTGRPGPAAGTAPAGAAASPRAVTRPPADGLPRPAPGPGGQALPSQFARVLVETLAGTRPPRQLTSWTTERARSRIQRMGPVLTAGQRPQLRRVVARQPAADVIEMTVLLSVGPQVRALAVRLEHTAPRPASAGRPVRPGKWLCTQVEAA
ncbi:MAG TPA: Rv3235 family protein [Streptosporangiaceae bacterium]|nr:Rv3235 family protein [Streptosporangiaceae bacterium]